MTCKNARFDKTPTQKMPKAFFVSDRNRQQATGNRQQATGNRQQATVYTLAENRANNLVANLNHTNFIFFRFCIKGIQPLYLLFIYGVLR
jgi:hypothetical protein